MKVEEGRRPDRRLHVVATAWCIAALGVLFSKDFFLAAARNPSGQDFPVWVSLCAASAAATAAALGVAFVHRRFAPRRQVFILALALLLLAPGQVVLLAFALNPP